MNQQLAGYESSTLPTNQTIAQVSDSHKLISSRRWQLVHARMHSACSETLKPPCPSRMFGRYGQTSHSTGALRSELSGDNPDPQLETHMSEQLGGTQAPLCRRSCRSCSLEET